MLLADNTSWLRRNQLATQRVRSDACSREGGQPLLRRIFLWKSCTHNFEQLNAQCLLIHTCHDHSDGPDVVSTHFTYIVLVKGVFSTIPSCYERLLKRVQKISLWEPTKGAPFDPRGPTLFTPNSGFTLGIPVFTHYTSARRRYALVTQKDKNKI